MFGKIVVVLLCISLIGVIDAGLVEFLNMATNIAGMLGTQNSGQLRRSDDCVINWSFQGMMKGIHWKYMGTCVDSCTHESEVVFYLSRQGAVEHCLQNLLRKIARRGEL